ncbi:MAG: CvpA family protein [candidate division WOR-3 bacterium]
MHPFDIFTVFVLLLSFLIGVIYGLWRLITSWFSLAFSFLFSYNLSPLLKKFLPKFVPFSHFLTFILIFLFSIVLFAFLFKIGEKAIKSLGLSFWDKLLGSIFLFFLSILLILAIIHLLESLSLSYLIKGAKTPSILLEIESKVLNKFI